MTTALAFSPHLDDAVFSAGGLLWRLARRGVRVIVATLFTGNVPQPTGFALACQLDKGLGSDVDYMALRREEDAAACAMLRAEPLHLPLLEAPHRGYDSPAALFGGVQPNDPAKGPVRQAVAELASSIRPDYILGPLGVGGHVDHVLVQRALREIAAPPVIWWEDWPYADRAPAGDGSRQHVHGVTLTLEARDVKATACAAYASQLGFQFGGEQALRRRVRQQTSERIHSATPADWLSG